MKVQAMVTMLVAEHEVPVDEAQLAGAASLTR